MCKQTLYKVVGKKIIKWVKRWILDMIQPKILAIDIRIAIGKGSDAIIVLQRVNSDECSVPQT